MLLGLAAVPLLLAVGVATDMVRVNQVRTVLQGAVDTASLAGGTSKEKTDAELQLVVEQYLEANHASEVLEYVSSIDQTMDMSKGTFTVSVDGKIPTTFMVLAGITEINVGAKSTVNVGSQALELVMVLDNTGSMSGSKIANLKTAATNLVNIIEAEKSDYSTVKMGVVPFAEYVNIGTGNMSASWLDTSATTPATWAGCVGSRPDPYDLNNASAGGNYPALDGVPCNTEVLPLTSNLSTVKTKIGAMVSTGATYIPTGLLWGWHVIDSSAPFTEASTTAQMTALNGRKAIVLMTDGENTISPTYPAHDGADTGKSNTSLKSICDNVKNDGVEIFTVSFMVPTTAIKNILEDCATTPQKYFDADNAAELNAAFNDIAQSLSAIRLTN